MSGARATRRRRGRPSRLDRNPGTRPQPCPDRDGRGERGAATILALAIVGAIVALAAALAGVLVASVASQVAANAADAAALAAADAVSGAVAGEPCDLAARLADRNGARLSSCDVSGAEVVIVVSVTRAALTITASARAGPPG
ncbi:Rv3654c family TadE-like protein [Agromyces aurantiacus]|uniref:Rv3654c family TadE-like protein n=1 Tax=Agromyces aurantiacus TaxID=165814 RepID=A0ABV9R5D4_9MICO|nr:Rv3654c family TadE-like protein [Agromyces aurantiacus]MBM7504016.1 secretion/DNA translocation related TadE-like protein [Agromyces aurantiacus]